MRGTPARIQRVSALIAIEAVACAVALAFGRILEGRAPTYRLLCVGLVSGAVAWASERRGMLIATLLSAIGLIVALGWIVASRTLWLGVPTLETVHTFGQLATQIGAQAREYVSPAPATPALLFAGAIAVWAAIFSCYALAFRAQSPLLALVPPLALVVFADGVLDQFSRPAYGIGFLVAALAVLFADSLRRLRSWGPVWGQAGDARDRLWPVTGRNARRVGLTVLAAAVVAPWAVPGFGSNLGLGLFSVDGGGGGIGVSPFASIGAVLNDPSSSTTPVFTIRATRGSYWRMLSLDQFDGTTWAATPSEGASIPRGGVIPSLAPGGHELTQHVTVEGDFTSPWLIAAAEPTSIRVHGSVSWHAASLSVQVDPWLDPGDGYVVTSVQDLPTDDDLRSLGILAPNPELSVLPSGIPSVVAETAHAWADGQPTTFDEVMSIERNLRSPPFYYDPTASYPNDPRSFADVLTTHAGFCQHFASLMAVMLRELGIPARVAYGFTPGTHAGDTWTVMLSNLHTWVEALFPGYGWLTFEPTPGGGFGDPSAATYDSLTPVQDPGEGCKKPGGCGLGGGRSRRPRRRRDSDSHPIRVCKRRPGRNRIRTRKARTPVPDPAAGSVRRSASRFSSLPSPSASRSCARRVANTAFEPHSTRAARSWSRTTSSWSGRELSGGAEDRTRPSMSSDGGWRGGACSGRIWIPRWPSWRPRWWRRRTGDARPTWTTRSSWRQARPRSWRRLRDAASWPRRFLGAYR